jgi:acylphosphatase
MRRVRLIAEGRVQGVWFRASARDEARRLGLTGWVRNLSDGRVEAEAQGEDADVDAFVSYCAAGPGRAVVDQLEVSQVPSRQDERGFQIR